MASLPLPLTSATPSSQSRPIFARPSYFLTHAKRSNRLRVSCTDGRNKKEASRNVETPLGKVDRRNMLLGLGGGLYGAANLISTPGASADPVKPPQLDTCGNSTYSTNLQQTIEVACCPPTSQNPAIDYQLPPVTQMKIRPAAQNLSPEYIYKYNKAIECMKKLQEENPDDPRGFMQQANIHCAYCNGAYTYPQPGQDPFTLQTHFSWLFFPFHRWYLYFYERILGKLIGDPTFALPFWNWDNPKGMKIPKFFLDHNSPLYDCKRNQKHLKSVVDLGFTGSTDPLQVVSNNLTVMYNEMIGANTDVYDFMGQPYCQGTQSSYAAAGAVERGSHTAVHVFVGDPREAANEDLGNFYSAARDPLFFCHHANVDRMWTLWQYDLSSEQIPDKTIHSDNFNNAEFLFYDENAQLVRVKVGDCVNNQLMGYDFEEVDLPWVDYRPPPQTTKAKVTRATKTAENTETVFPLKLDQIVRIIVPKTKKGKADESLVIENITIDASKFLKFDVFVNDEDDDLTELDKAAYAGTFAQVPHKGHKTVTTWIKLRLTDLYKRMDVEDDDTVLVTLVPRHQGEGVTIGGVKIIENPPPPKSSG
ncbi:Polyphenol oxidase II, chloroplastic [Sesamum alatum]|uniref:Polyphenol oxidase II, chloroplastic n=1 Tax=Sesamum alatum TaxID=300844 RepID=A0AAE1XYV3_9LAMI|nr:Polyphenol oxidase II, chloroplastic [Sesamum alatum]